MRDKQVHHAERAGVRSLLGRLSRGKGGREGKKRGEEREAKAAPLEEGQTERKDRKGGGKSAGLSGRREIGSGRNLSLKGTGYASDRPD